MIMRKLILVILILAIGATLIEAQIYSSKSIKKKNPVMLYDYKSPKYKIEIKGDTITTYLSMVDTNVRTINISQDPLYTTCADSLPTIKKAYLSLLFRLGGDEYLYGDTTFDAIYEFHIYAYTASYVKKKEIVQRLRINGQSYTKTGSPEALAVIDVTSLVKDSGVVKFAFKTPIIISESFFLNLRKQLDLQMTYYQETASKAKKKSNPAQSMFVIVAPTTTSYPSYNGIMTFQWGLNLTECPGDSVPMSQIQVMRLYDIDSTNGFKAVLDWSKALTLEVQNKYDINGRTKLDIGLAEGDGYYVWRVRPIGNFYDKGFADDRNWGAWTEVKQNGVVKNNLDTITDLPNLYGGFRYNQNDALLNWILKRNFSDGNNGLSISENMSFADNLLNVRQTQKYLYSKQNILVTQTVPDNLGRPALVTLPAPVSGYIKYQPSFVKDSLNIRLYTSKNYDSSSYGASGLNYTFPRKMGSATPLGTYYSGTNSVGFIPSAHGNPFVRTLYYNDGTGRVRDVSLAGDIHKINANSTKERTVRTYYSSVSDKELIAMFGQEAPADTTVYKVTTIDQNQVASLTYKSRDGQVLATCFAKKQGDTLLTTLNTASSDTVENEREYVISIDDTVKGFDKINDNVYMSSKKLAFSDSTPVTINYSMTPNKYNITGGCFTFCATCDYHVIIKVKNVETGLTVSTLSIDTVMAPGGSCTSIPVNLTKTATVAPGSYIFEKKLITNNARTAPPDSEPSSFKQYYKELYKQRVIAQAANDTNIAKVFKRLDSAEKVEKISVLYKYLDSLVIAKPSIWTFSATDSTYGVLTTCCGKINIPKLYCYECHLDTIPNFEKYLTNMWKDSIGVWLTRRGESFAAGMDTNISQYFFRGHQKFYRTTDGGIFNKMIKNMLADPVHHYDTCKLWECWQAIVLSFQLNATVFDPVLQKRKINRDYSLLDAFLDCAGYCYDGISNHEYGNPGANQYGLGYKDYAYKFFPYFNAVNDPEGKGRGRNLNCETTIFGINLFTTTMAIMPSYNPPPDNCNGDYNSQKLKRLAGCALQNLTTSDTKDDNGACLDAGSVVVGDTTKCIYKQKFAIENDCKSACSARFDEFVQDAINYYHSLNLTVQGDNGSWTGGIYDKYMRDVYCLAQSMVNQCEANCNLTVFDTVVGSTHYVKKIGTDLEFFNIKKVKFFQPVLSMPVSGACTVDSVHDFLRTSLITPEEHAFLLAKFVNLKMYEYRINALSTVSVDSLDLYTVLTNNCHQLNTYLDYFVYPHAIPSCITCNLVTVNIPTVHYYPGALESCIADSLHTVYDPLDTLQTTPVMFYAFWMDNQAYRVPPLYDFIFYNAKETPGSSSKCALWLKRVCNLSTPAKIDSMMLCNNVCCTTGCCQDSACLTWVDPRTVSPPDTAFIAKEIPCAVKAVIQLRGKIFAQFDDCGSLKSIASDAVYDSACVNSGINADLFRVSYTLDYYHYTLFYYDRAGNLIRTVPPKGIAPMTTSRANMPSHQYVSFYRYNTLGQVIIESNPDIIGQKYYSYNAQSQLRSFQTPRYFASMKYNYVSYDPQGRVKESGLFQYNPADMFTNPGIFDVLKDNDNFPSPSSKLFFTKNIYSKAFPALPKPYNVGYKQRFIRNRISYSYRNENPAVDHDSTYLINKSCTIYSYDPQGNVEWVIQVIPMPYDTSKRLVAKIDYEYDPLSGKVTRLVYNKNRRDEYQQRYTYDDDNRLVKVESSRFGDLWDRDAQYDYYQHGPLKRVSIGEDSVQGIDYTYTINGWLKSINAAMGSVDPGKDYGTTHPGYNNDLFAETINYFYGDYHNTAMTGLSDSLISSSALKGRPLYNGNISATISRFDTSTYRALPGIRRLSGERYKYDVLNRLLSAEFDTLNGSTWQNNKDEYDSFYSYDPNGNLRRLTRHQYDASCSGVFKTLLDSLYYQYVSGKNRISNVTERESIACQTDPLNLKPGSPYASSPSYDNDGSMIDDWDQNLEDIAWTVEGKPKYILKDNIYADYDSLAFIYDAQGRRIGKVFDKRKSVYLDDRDTSYTFYVRDANGEILAVYKAATVISLVDTNTTGLVLPYNTFISDTTFGPSVVSWYVYGSGSQGRLCEWKPDSAYASLNILVAPASYYWRTIGRKEYEFKDHLGNVRGVFSDIKLIVPGSGVHYTNTRSLANYYPFGMMEPGRQWAVDSTLFGYQGQMKDDEIAGRGNSINFEFRMYDPRLGRFNSIDPRIKNYPFQSPYVFAENRVIDGIELEGLEYLRADKAIIEFKYGAIQLKVGNLFSVNRSDWYEKDNDPNQWSYNPKTGQKDIGVNRQVGTVNLQFKTLEAPEIASLDRAPGATDPTESQIENKVMTPIAKSTGLPDARYKVARAPLVGSTTMNQGLATAMIGVNILNFGLYEYANMGILNDFDKFEDQSALAKRVGQDFQKGVSLGLVPPAYQNQESGVNIMNVIFQGVNNTSDPNIYKIGMSIFNQVSSPYMLIKPSNPPGADNTSVGKPILVKKPDAK